MEVKEALQQLDEINKLIETTNKLLFPGKRLMAYGVLILFIPLIQSVTQNLTFGAHFGEFHLFWMALIHIVFYFLLFRNMRWVARRLFEKVIEGEAHPLLLKAVYMHWPILACIIGTILVTIPTGYGHLCYPLVFVFFGLLFNLYGRFSGKVIVAISWSYIVLGFIYFLLTKYEIPDLWIYFNTYLGASMFLVGFKSRNSQVHV